MKIFKSATYLIFFVLIIQSGFFYSILWHFVPWGNDSDEGLFFLAFYIIDIPLLAIIAFIKRLILKGQNQYLRNSFFIYTFLIALPALDTYGSQISVGLGTTICAIVCICIVIELIKYRKQIFYPDMISK